METFPALGNEKIVSTTQDQTVNLVLHTLLEGKQVLVFNNSKSRSEATAEKISNAVKNVEDAESLKKIADRVLKSLSSPTKQCRRLAKIVEKGVAFHHSGLTAKQRSLIEKSFREGLIKVISSTPTLAAGLNLPAYKVIINDYKRYSPRGYNDIPVLEFHQMAGRAGRPGKEKIGKAVVMLRNEDELERVVPKYVFGKPEEIVSKLAVEPTLKMYVLSLISMDMINSTSEIKDFFSNTLYAYQYRDLDALYHNIFRIIRILKDYDFVIQEDDYYMATQLGKKVSELYLNPDTAHYFMVNIDKFIERFSESNVSKYDLYSLIYFVSDTMEMRPLFNIAKTEEENYVQRAEDVGDSLIVKFDPFEMDYVEFLKSLKLSDVFSDWINEAPEDYVTEKYRITPGELHYKLETLDWLLYCLEEIALLKKSFYFRNYINKLRVRFKAGIKEELIPFVALKGIGRVRARKLHNGGLKKIVDLKRADFASLARLVGDSMAIKIKEQIKEEIIERPLEHKPKEIKVREVSDDEIEAILESVNTFEKEKNEKNLKLNEFF